MSKLNAETNKKYLGFLQEVYANTINESKLHTTELLDKHRVNGRVKSVMVGRGILRKIKKPEGIYYKWNTREPDIRMANAIRVKVNDIIYEKRLARLSTQEQVITKDESVTTTKSVVKTAKVETRKSREVSILWGLVKVKY
jgi:hypothetical protein